MTEPNSPIGNDPQATPPLEYSTTPAGSYMGPEPDKNAKTMGMLCHLLSLAGLIIPFGNIIGPLVIWLMKKEESPFIDDQGKESLNFQIWVTILALISVAAMCIVIGIFLLPLVGLYSIIFTIIASIKANDGVAYRYPVVPFRLLK